MSILKFALKMNQTLFALYIVILKSFLNMVNAEIVYWLKLVPGHGAVQAGEAEKMHFCLF